MQTNHLIQVSGSNEGARALVTRVLKHSQRRCVFTWSKKKDNFPSFFFVLRQCVHPLVFFTLSSAYVLASQPLVNQALRKRRHLKTQVKTKTFKNSFWRGKLKTGAFETAIGFKDAI